MDLVHSKLIVVWGANPGASNTHLQPIITQAKKNGAVVVVIDPRRISAADRADLHIALRPGTDVVFGYAVARWINEHNRVDNNFVAEHVTGAEQFLLAANEWTLERASEICGVTVADIERFAELVTTIKPATLRVGLGMERNRNGGSAYLAAFGMWALTGNFGTLGSGVYGSTSGGFPNSVFAQWPQGVARPAQKKINMNRVGRVLRGEPGAWHVPAKVLVIQGANPAVTAVDQQGMLEGLANEDVFVVLHEQVMTDTALLADVVLPATTHFEIHDVVGSYGAYVVQENRRVIEPVGESRSNGELAEALAVALGFSADEFDASRQAIETLVSESMCGTTPVRPEGGTIQFRDVFPSLDDQRMRIWELDSDMPGPKYEQLVDQAHPLTLLTPSTSYTINSMFGDTLPPPAVLKLHPIDASMHGVVTGETVTMFNDRASIAVEVEVDASMRQGVCAMPKGLWRRSIASGLTANAFAPDTFSDLADGACFNDARVQIKKLATK
jgi:anaerobic selenocysteine-containing dehydrogenase